MRGNLIKAALEPLGFPVWRLVYKGKESTFFTFQMVLGLPIIHADDESTEFSEIWRVDLYSRIDYTELLEQAMENLKRAGFSVSVDPETYESGTGFFHVPLNLEFTEV